MIKRLPRKYFCSLLFLLLLPSILFSQKQPDNFPFHHVEYYDSKQGLSGNEVYWAIQDKNGFMWFITDIGLNRFDGYSFRSWSYRIDDPNSLAPSASWKLTEGKNGTLWMASNQQGIYSFDPVHEKFMHYRHHAGNNNSLAEDHDYAIAAATNGSIWIGTENGLDKFDPQSKKFTHFIHHDLDSSSITSDYINGMVMDGNDTNDANGNLWIFTDKPGTDLFNTKTGKLIKHFDCPFPEIAGQWDGGTNMNLSGTSKNTIWIGSNDSGIYGFNTSTRQFIRIKMEHTCNSDYHISGFYSVAEDHDGNLWTTNDENKVVYYHRAEKKFYFQQVNGNNNRFLINPGFITGFIAEDSSHKIWIGTNNGLITFDTKQKNIFICRHDDNDPHSISGNFVYGINRTRQNLFFVAASTIQLFDKKTNSFSYFPLTENGEDINTDITWSIYQDSKEMIWFVGYSGIISYNPFTKKNHLYHLRNDSTELCSRNFTGIIEDKKGWYWTGNWGDGLYSFNPATSKAKVYTVPEGSNTMSTNNLGPTFQDSRGIIYVAGWEGGFITFNPDSEKFKIYHHDAKDPSSVSNQTCHALLETPNGLIWFGTLGGGINVFNPANEKFKSFTTHDGLVNDYVNGLIEDKNGNYWALTRGGISRFKIPDDPFNPGCNIKFRNYDISDGLPSNVLGLLSAFCDYDGTLYFGTRNAGMFYFHPDDLKDNGFIPPVYITEFRLMNKTVSTNDSNSVLKTSIEFTKELSLRYRQNMISFTFAALNYFHPEKNKYAYMLEGFDKNWIYTDASKRFANYTNLDAGEYIFKVKASNNDGIWNEKPTELKIIITPPFWKTTWFKILVAITIIGIAYAFYRYRIGQILLLQRIRNKIAADLHDDIGSTLNSISVYSEVAKKDPARKDFALNMIGESSRRIIDSLSDIVWSINPENDNFDKIILRMRSHTHNLLKAKKIECTFKADESLNGIKLPMEIRRNFYLIFKEAMNNLVKYSNANRASVILTLDSREVTCVIRDDGVGFDASLKYNGNGLNNMKRRANEIKAMFNIESGIGKGTSVELNMKI